jgi:glutamate/tyrosine decarboxylase-like PLP-dependent enzyme
MELADSITGDCHKGLNVPYDCGFFFTRSAATLPVVFQNANAVYLSASPTSIPSALNSNLENSRRFRALPVYAVLLAHGRKGVSEMMARQVRLARLIAQFISESEHYELLPKSTGEVDFRETGIMVLFRATAEKINEVLVDRINNSRTVYMSGTQWEGRKAVRIAVSNWKVEETRDVEIVKEILMDLLEES